MRVLDAGSTHTYKMGKNRKHRIRKNKENEAEESSDDGVAMCPHIVKAVNFAAMRKTLLKQTCTFGECTGCVVEATRSGAKDLFGSPLEGAAACAAEDSDLEPSIWVCLQCGHQGCDRNSREKHALKHFDGPHTGFHCIVANLTTWSSWCYSCDNDIPVETSKRVLECIDFLRKQAGLPRIEFSHFAGQRGIQVTSHSDISPTDPTPPTSQSRADKSQVAARSAGVACQKVKGLSNLGNTCFFNAVMQNLCQTHSLETLLMSGCKKGRSMSIGGWREFHTDSDSSGEGEEEEDRKPKELPMIDIVPGDSGPLTQSLLSFVQEMNNGSAHSTVTPSTFFSHVCKKAPQFKGFQQQDSHELLRYLLDVVRSEEIKRSQSGILKYFKLPETVNPKKVDEETKTKIREYGRQVKYTFLDSLFGGQLVSTVTCEECKHISQIFEPFLDLSLPVTEEKPQRPNQLAASRRKDSAAAAAAAAVAALAAAAGGGEAQGAEAGTPMGVEGFADRSDKSGKYQDRKNRRQTRKETKRKGRLAQTEGPQGKSVEEGKVVGVREGEERGVVKGQGGLQGDGSSNGLDVEEEHSSPHDEDPSDADVEDNVESETSRLQPPQSSSPYESHHCRSASNPHPPVTTTTTTTTTIPPSTITSSHNNIDHRNNNHHHQHHTTTNSSSSLSSCSNLNLILNLQRHNCCESDGAFPGSDLSIKGEKENHILPAHDLSPRSTGGDSQPCSLDSLTGSGGYGGRNSSGIKEAREVVEKLTNGVSNLELDRAGEWDSKATPSGREKPSRPECNNSSHHPSFSLGRDRHHHYDSLGPAVVSSNPVDSRPKPPPSPSFSELHGAVQDVAAPVESVARREGDSGGKDTTAAAVLWSVGDGAAGTEAEGRSGEAGSGCGSVVGGGSVTGGVVVVGGSTTTATTPPPNGDNKTTMPPPPLPNQVSGKTPRQLRREAQYKSKTTLAPRYHPSPKECSVMSCLHQFMAAELLTGTNKVGCKNCTRLRPKNATPHKDKKGSDMVYSNAAKQFLILVPPAVLTLHLKRFEQVGYTCRKVNRQVDFPPVLDLAPYCSSLCPDVRSGQRRLLYSLYGLVEHSGRLQGGHYTAYVKVRPSLGPLTNFLKTQPSNPCEYIRRYMEQVQVGASCGAAEEDCSIDLAAAEAMLPPGRWFHVSDSRINEVTEATVLRAQAYLLFYERVY